MNKKLISILSKKADANNEATIIEFPENEVKIKVRNLSLKYDGKEALKNLSFDIPEKKIVAIVGPSGSGKSTLIRCFNRMNEISTSCLITGEVIIDNENIYSWNVLADRLRAKVGMVFQKPNPFPMSVYKNVIYGPRLNGVRSNKVLKSLAIEALENAGMKKESAGRLNESALNFSGGQQQRICIARALAMKPEVILFDEPTSALDLKATDKIESLLLKLRKDYTIILVTHTIKQAIRVADYVMFLKDGELIEYNKTQSVLVNPKQTETRDFLYSTEG